MQFTFVDLEKLYERDPQLKREDLQILAEWTKKQPHLTSAQVTDLQLALFLHSCYYRIEMTKDTIDKYFTLKAQYTDILDPLSKDELKKNLSVGFLNLLPDRTPEDYVVMFIKLLDSRMENFNFVNLIRALVMTALLNLHKMGFVEGVVVVFDLKGFTLGHMARLNLMALKKGLIFLQEAAPIRLKSIHFINIVPFMDKLVGLAKPFLKQELYEMLNFHHSLDTLEKYVPKRCLPDEYGGEAGSVDSLNESSMKNLIDNFDFYGWHDVQKADVTKRYDKEKCSDEIFGMEGSFKKLEID